MSILTQIQEYAFDQLVTYELVERDSILMNPLFIANIIIGYLYIVLRYGPAKMKNRAPYNVRLYTRVFNVFQVLANMYIVSVMSVENAFNDEMKFFCPKPIREASPELQRVAIDLIKVSLVVRLSDFSETICFVLAKKFNHITFLHVYHHVAVVLFLYTSFIRGYAHIINFIALINSSVHVVMYLYFFLATFESLKPYLWWKKYLTALQISQFVAAMIVTAVNISSGCPYPPAVHAILAANSAIFFALFVHFYIKTYTHNKNQKIA